MTPFPGFSRLNRSQRIRYIVENSRLTEREGTHFNEFDSIEKLHQKALQEMIENFVGNFPIPFGVVPGLLINGSSYLIPFVTEESSVVAAASKAAKYWSTRGGFSARVDSVTKKGQVHFNWDGNPDILIKLFPGIRKKLFVATENLTEKMRKRGGGITDIQLLDKSKELPNYYQIDVSFETAEAMGANFINSCLETIASVLLNLPELNTDLHNIEIIMSILSNYTPDCKVNCSVECPVENLTGWNDILTGVHFATKFKQAVDIAQTDISRAVTHNKGILNGVDAVLLATGNDWRATSASAHAYAARDGKYKALTTISLTDNIFRYELEIPLAIGTVGGITEIHPMVSKAFAMMKDPDARTLMMIAAAAGLACNFSAIASLITTGIQEGHMKMHLSNIFNKLNIGETEREMVRRHFSGKTISNTEAVDFITKIRRTL
jgi:hydroxymethylglutaryl-CoA reductase